MIKTPSRTLELKKVCLVCKKEITILVDPLDFRRWREGEYAQTSFPYLTIDERELLISGTCGPCFDYMCAGVPEC